MSGTAPRVSVVIPAYNRAGVVGRAITSVLEQSVREFECIVVDDGSTDATREAIEAVADDRVEYVRSDHGGAAAARNLGAGRARAPWLTFLDSDDTVARDWLASLLAETCVAGTALVSCGYTDRLDPTGETRGETLPRVASASVGPIIECISTGGSYMVRRDLFLEVGGFHPRQAAAQHQELALRLGPVVAQRGARSAAVMRPLVTRWIGRGDHIRSNDEAVFDGCVRLIAVHRDRLALDPPVLANTAATAAYRAVRMGRFYEARRLLTIAVRTDPRNLKHWKRLAALAVPGLARRYTRRDA
jgi:glycosyltransferase involved in cell wall biosynthesis